MKRFPGLAASARIPVAALGAALLLAPTPAPGRVLAQEEAEGQAPEILGTPSAWEEGALDEQRILVPAGTPLRERPDPRAPILSHIRSDSELPELERRGAWVQVRFFDTKGWLIDPRLDPAGEGGGTAADGALGPVPYEPTAPAPEVLARARSLLRDGGAERALGPWTLYTDVDHPELLASLGRLATSLAGIYRERYGLDPGLASERGSEIPAAGGSGREAVVLFARERDQRRFLGEGSILASLDAEGYAGAGLVVLRRGDRSDDAVRSLLVHELVHLLDRRALGPRTPPWLEEGLAHSLASSRITPSGRLEPRKLGGETRVVDRRIVGPDGEIRVTVETTGGLAGLERVVGALDRGALPSLERLTSLGWSEMADPGGRELRYAQAGLFVRFLLDGEQGRWRDGFRSYLAALAEGDPRGDPGEPDRLLDELGADWPTLEATFHPWLRSRWRVHEQDRGLKGGSEPGALSPI